MKPSKYSFFYPVDNGQVLAYNAVTTGLAVMPEEEYARYLRIAEGEEEADPASDLVRNLCRGGFLLEDGTDEEAELKVESLMGRFGGGQLYLTIAPTLACNFACPYCYEEHLKVRMAEEVQDALLAWIEKQAPGLTLLYVTWFGGEPTLNLPAVERLSKGFADLASQHGFRVHQTMVSNGYLLDREKAALLASLGVKRVQITLDGPPEVHDLRRPLTGGKPSFAVILANLKAIHDLLRVDLRINVDKTNAARVPELLGILAREELKGKVHPYFARVEAHTSVCANIAEDCIAVHEYSEEEARLDAAAMEAGFDLARVPYRVRGAYCTADRLKGFVVAPDGSLFKCWHHVTTGEADAVGHVARPATPAERRAFLRHMAWDPFDKAVCRGCKVFPICMGGCPVEGRKFEDRGQCLEWKFNLRGILEALYRRWKQGRQSASSAP